MKALRRGSLSGLGPSSSYSNAPYRFTTHTLPCMFGLDYRSMALFRICIGILLLLDLCVRSTYLHDHYANNGVWPNHEAVESYYAYSVHFINGHEYFQAAMFLLNGLFILFMIIGWHTRIFTCMSWFMLTSLHNRNMLVLNGGDDFLRVMMFWAMFLPLGARYSVDATNLQTNQPAAQAAQHHGTPANKYYLSWASAAPLLQFSLVYWFTAALKDSPEWQSEFTAVYYAVHLDQFATVWAVMLRGFPAIMKMLTFVTWYFEFYGPFFFFLPFSTLHGPVRTLGVLGFIAMHFGFGMCLELGFFMYIPGVSALLFLPAWFWDNLANFFKTKTSFTIIYNPRVYGLDKALSLFRMFFLLRANATLVASYSTTSSLSAASPAYARVGGRPTVVDSDDDKYNKGVAVMAGGSMMAGAADVDGLGAGAGPAGMDSVSINMPASPAAGTRPSPYNSSSSGEEGYDDDDEDQPFPTGEWISVVDDMRDTRYTGYDGVLQLVRASVLFFTLPLLRADIVRRVGSSIIGPYIMLPMAKKLYPRYPTLPAVAGRRFWIKEIILCFLIFTTINWNFATFYQYPVNPTYRWVTPALRLDQWWGMFSPHPPKVDGWMYMPGELHDGTHVNVFEGFGVRGGKGDARVEVKEDGSRVYTKPELVSHQFPIQRWRKYLMNLQGATHQDKRLHFGRYLCREWNWYGRHPGPKQLKNFRIMYIQTYTPAPGQTPLPDTPIELWNHAC
eukprot:TRINITY_DN905_c0_g2_i2.p1 TRINITY_DN905_c0_g2~~TRINITY_DN905_c0_g2_i2.p1  ORF type:complete len:777 (+),score=147.85 TRINITY_DN905_c0_g2_i2:145-2331(+)